MKQEIFLIINPVRHNNAYNVWLIRSEKRGEAKLHRPLEIGPAANLISEYDGSNLYYSVHGKYISKRN